jgi:signal transduction histidine kinase/CheY-like chemotaxis protein
MSIAAAMSLMAFALTAYVAGLSQRFSVAPGWREQRWFSVMALTAAAYSAADIPASTPSASDALVRIGSLFQLAVGAVHLAAWFPYAWAILGRTPSRRVRAVQLALLAMALSVFIPGAVYPGAMRSHAVAWLGVEYREPIPTVYGDLVVATLLSTFVALTVIFGLAWRRGVRSAGLHCATLIVVCAMAVNDALALEGVLKTPYLLDFGFFGPVLAVAWSLTGRFADDARALADLRGRLEAQVEARSRELGEAQQALMRSEKLAALGQLAAGVAHEVNSPIAVVSANLRYLGAAYASGEAPEDATQCVREAESAAQRIAQIVRQLLDAGRMAAAPVEVIAVDAQAMVAEAVVLARQRCPQARIESKVPAQIYLRGQDAPLTQVLANLIVNGAQADPSGKGRVEIRAETKGERVRLTVEDDGPGMSEDVLRRAFEPFFSTRPVGLGKGLGLAVSRGIVHSLGGELRLDSEPGRGTRAMLELAAAPPPLPSPQRVGPGRLLLVAEEAALRTALPRLLESTWEVSVAAGVDEALDRLAQEGFDVVLCELGTPEGAGERLFWAMREQAPAQAERVVFLAGATLGESERRFLASQPQPVIEKPLDLAALERVAARLARAG